MISSRVSFPRFASVRDSALALSAAALIAALSLALPARALDLPAGPDLALRAAIALGCASSGSSVADMAAGIPGAVSGSEAPYPAQGPAIGWTRTFPLRAGGRIRVERFMPEGALTGVVAEYDAPGASRSGDEAFRPLVAIHAPPSCEISDGRELIYDARGEAVAVAVLDESLSTELRVEPLDAPVPAGVDPGGVTVAEVDTGVNYLLPGIASRLARDSSGHILGYDYWDMTARPFDRHIRSSLFFPERHGTMVASVLLREAPDVRLVPYRYPRPAMGRFVDLFDDAAKKGVRILTLSLGSFDESDWSAFAQGAARHPDMLVITSAGNDGRDLDAQPVYPAAFDLKNQITVTSLDGATGRLAEGANWGARTVDLAVPGEDIPVTEFDGSHGTASGSSFAAPRVAALAARLLLAHPDWHAAELKAAIFARATALADHKVRHGYILDPEKP
jgi:subtilisin family serine protease